MIFDLNVRGEEGGEREKRKKAFVAKRKRYRKTFLLRREK